MKQGTTRFLAHSVPELAVEHWHTLADHLTAVSALAESFARPFNGGSLAHASGLLHDLGKYTDAFQARLRGRPDRVDHATWGARIALERYGTLGYLIAYPIAGHHAGLCNGRGDAATRSTLHDRLHANLPTLDPAWSDELHVPAAIEWPTAIKPRTHESANFTAAFLTRMVFSCLVDADYLDTEAFYVDAEGRQPRRSDRPAIPALNDALSLHLKSMVDAARATVVNAERKQILEHVLGQAPSSPGLYSLTVPTGGGKTLTSLAFALLHANLHGLERLIYVAPFTSVVEQTAQVFRYALGPLGDAAVLEHHSAYTDDPTRAPEARQKTRLAMENWDAAVVVTTAVQFFESLFGDRPSQCRKLHNVAGCVIVLDEAQTLPLKLLRPTLLALDELARNYGCTIVFCTATQPALSDARFRDVIGAMRELAPDPKRLFDVFKRVTVRHVGPKSDASIAEHLLGSDQCLCIVNNRLHARALYQAIRHEPGAHQLSTLMCARHRSNVLRQIRASLKVNAPCRVVSTSLIEAGVDVSFPLVMRAEAGLDSVAQAAGRCNREGVSALEASNVLVFEPDTQQWKPPKELEQFAAVARQVFRRHASDPLNPSAIEDYFFELYWTRGTEALDAKDLLGLLRRATLDSLPFEDVARDYRLIESVQATVIVPYDDVAKAAIQALASSGAAREPARTLQPYTVQVPRAAFQRLLAAGAVQAIAPDRWGDQFFELTNASLYDDQFGLFWDDPTFIHAAQLVQ